MEIRKFLKSLFALLFSLVVGAVVLIAANSVFSLLGAAIGFTVDTLLPLIGYLFFIAFTGVFTLQLFGFDIEGFLEEND